MNEPPSGQRFVVLQHFHGAGHHFDFMLEDHGLLLTWRLSRVPELGERVTAERIGDHRLAYLDYEGPLTRDRGHVVRVDRGQYERLAWEDGRLRVALAGRRLCGIVTLWEESDHWILERETPTGAEPVGA